MIVQKKKKVLVFLEYGLRIRDPNFVYLFGARNLSEDNWAAGWSQSILRQQDVFDFLSQQKKATLPGDLVESGKTSDTYPKQCFLPGFFFFLFNFFLNLI